MRTDRSRGHPAATAVDAVAGVVVDAGLAVLLLVLAEAVDVDVAVAVGVAVVVAAAAVVALVEQEQVLLRCPHHSRNHSRNAVADVHALARVEHHNRNPSPDNSHGVVATRQDTVELARVLLAEPAAVVVVVAVVQELLLLSLWLLADVAWSTSDSPWHWRTERSSGVDYAAACQSQV